MPSHFWCKNLLDNLGNYLSIWKKMYLALHIELWYLNADLKYRDKKRDWELKTILRLNPKKTII